MKTSKKIKPHKDAKAKERKIVQFQIMPQGISGVGSLLVLCDDGTLWEKSELLIWKPFPPVPGGEPDYEAEEKLHNSINRVLMPDETTTDDVITTEEETK